MGEVVTFEQRVRARINEVAADLIPAEDLDRMVQGQIERFRVHDLPEMIKTAIRDEFCKAMKVELAKPEYQPMWSEAGSTIAGEAIRKLITENAGAMMSSMVAMMVQQAVHSMPRMPGY